MCGFKSFTVSFDAPTLVKTVLWHKQDFVSHLNQKQESISISNYQNLCYGHFAFIIIFSITFVIWHTTYGNTVDSYYLAPVGSQYSWGQLKLFSHYLARSCEGQDSQLAGSQTYTVESTASIQLSSLAVPRSLMTTARQLCRQWRWGWHCNSSWFPQFEVLNHTLNQIACKIPLKKFMSYI